VRLYRGLKNPYRPERVDPSRFTGGTDFTNCPALALRYAQGSRGVVLVVDIDQDEHLPSLKLTQELWLVPDAKRFMLWGRFDLVLTAVIPAKDLRAQLRLRGVRNAPDETKAVILRGFIARELRDQQLRSQLSPRTDGTTWPTSHEQAWVFSRER
jgi:hypothetical protein